MKESQDWMMEALGSMEPDPVWAERVRAQCHQAMAARLAARKKRPARLQLLDAVAVVVLCVYLALMFRAAARLL